MAGTTIDDVSKYLNALLTSDSQWLTVLEEVIEGQTVTDAQWIGILQSILGDIKSQSELSTIAVRLLNDLSPMIADSHLTGDDLVLAAISALTNNTTPDWVLTIVDDALAGHLNSSDLNSALTNFVQQYIGSNATTLLSSVLNNQLSIKTWQGLIGGALYVAGLLDAPADLSQESAIAAIIAALQKTGVKGIPAGLATKINDLITALSKGQDGPALLKALDILGVSSLPIVVTDLLKGLDVEKAVTDQLTEWLNKLNPGGSASNGDLAQFIVDVLTGAKKIFSVDDDKTALIQAGVMFDAGFATEYPLYQRYRKALFAAKLLSASGSLVSTDPQAPPLLIGLWISPTVTLGSVVGAGNIEFFRVLLATEFSAELRASDGTLNPPPSLVATDTVGDSFAIVYNAFFFA